MGVSLKRSALSPNIRERMDHSTAVLSAQGTIVAQAEHIPVHLGSFAIGAEALLAELGRGSRDPADGEMVLVNDPYISGTHLNDLMLLAPVFWKGRLAAYVVNKAHHVDVGGPVPGSLNPDARELSEEGLVIAPMFAVRQGRLDPAIGRLLRNNVREPQTAVGDLHAQIAANRLGVARVRQLLERYGRTVVEGSWQEAGRRARYLAERRLASMARTAVRSEDFVELREKKVRIRVQLRVLRHRLVADFSGTDDQVPAPLNAVLGVTFSATSFAVRTQMGGDLPTNGGFYDCVEVRAPRGCLVNPRSPAAVSGGNVETSQRIADVVLAALAQVVTDPLPANSSGTMFNVMMGGRRADRRSWAYYETIGGGSGARSRGPGVSGVHTNMTNTLNTPVEVAESTYPIRFLRYSLRPRSGGQGKYPGGEGIVRSFRLLRPARVSLLADRFRIPPPGRGGGRPGRPGKARVLRDGQWLDPGSKFTLELHAGDEVVLETPGGGGYGPAADLPSRTRPKRRAGGTR